MQNDMLTRLFIRESFEIAKDWSNPKNSQQCNSLLPLKENDTNLYNDMVGPQSKV